MPNLVLVTKRDFDEMKDLMENIIDEGKKEAKGYPDFVRLGSKDLKDLYNLIHICIF